MVLRMNFGGRGARDRSQGNGRGNSTARRSRRGFVLLETIVAFAILVLMLSVIYRTVSAGSQNVARAEETARVLELMQSEMARLGAETGLRPGRRESPLAEGVVVETSIARAQPVDSSASSDGAELMHIRLSAYRLEDRARQQPILTLEALRVQAVEGGS